MPDKPRKCRICGYQAARTEGRCAGCGAPFAAEPKVRRLGWVLFGIGIFLAVLMGIIAWQTAPTMRRPDMEIDGTRFTGSVVQGRWILGLFGAVILLLLGVLAGADGVFQIRNGRRNKWLLMCLIGAFALLMLLVLTVRLAL